MQKQIEVRRVPTACLKRTPWGPGYHAWDVFWVAAESIDDLLALDGADRATATGTGYYDTGEEGALINIARESPAWAACVVNGEAL